MAESLLAASSTQGVAQLCDPRSGALLRTLKDCRACGNGLAASAHFVATAERDRSFVHLWSWGKEQPHYRCQAPERLTCIAATADGAHCFAGAASGKLYLWQVASGRLLLAWDAHFKAATALALCSDNFLLSAGEDAIVLAWNVAQLLQAAAERIAPPPAMRTWTAHTLPVTSLVVAECGVHALIASASLDQTVRVWRLAEGVRECVHCVDFPSPLACLAAHPLHVSLYAGGTDGRIHPMPLLQPPHDASLGGAAAARPPPAATAHDGPVRSLCVAADGARLFSCAGAGGVWVWDASTLALLQKLLPHLAPDNLLLVRAPPLITAAAAAAAAAAAPLPPLLAPLKKYAEPLPEPSPEPTPLAMGCTPVRLGVQGTGHEHGGGVIDADGADLPLIDLQLPRGPEGYGLPYETLAAPGGLGSGGGAGGGGGGGGWGWVGAGGGSGDDAAKIAELQHQVAQYRKINSELYAIAAQSSLQRSLQ